MSDNALLIGSASADITPPPGVSMPGYFTDRKCDGVLDGIHARALVAEGDGRAIAIVACDCLFIPADFTRRIRRIVSERTGIAPGDILVAATHTHTGPILPRTFVPDEQGLVGTLYPGDPDEAYWEMFIRKAAGAVEMAWRDRTPSDGICVKVGSVEGIAFNRRYRMTDGSVRTNPGRNNPDVIEPAAPVDPAVTVASFPGHSACIVNYALHLDVVGGTRISPDYPGHMSRALRRLLGRKINCLFLNGACGDINHVDVSSTSEMKGNALSRRTGNVLAGEVLKLLNADVSAAGGPVAAASEAVTLHRRQPDASELALAEAALTRENLTPQNRSQAMAAVALARTGERTAHTEVQCLRIGDLALVGLPGEIFVEIGLEIKRRSPFPHTILVELANDWHGYIPTSGAFSEGGYETSYRSARFEPDTADRFVEAALRVLSSIA
jgi:neutral ceramidase